MFRTTEYYCPDCDKRAHRAFLKTDGIVFACPDCRGAYGGRELAAAYRDELAGLEHDAAYVRGSLERLRQRA